MLDSSRKYTQSLIGLIAFTFTLLQGIDWAFNKYGVGEAYFNIVLIALALLYITIAVVVIIKTRQKQNVSPRNKQARTKKLVLANLGLSVSLFLLFIYFFIGDQSSKQLLEDELPLIATAVDQGDNLYAFKKINELLEEYPENEILKIYLEKSTWIINVDTSPSAIDLYITYGIDSTWSYLGKTPIDSVYVPASTDNKFQIKFKVGDHSHVVAPGQAGWFDLYGLSQTPSDHVFMPGRRDQFMWFPGIDLGRVSYAPFSIGIAEVSNGQYQEFVNAKGYERPEFWDFPFTVDGEQIAFADAVKQFTGRHGQSGPAQWSYGKHPANQEDFPVTGVSWFEARAYARFKEMQLPNMYQWLAAANLAHTGLLPDISRSNLKSSIMRELADSHDANAYGIRNIAGNVKEWVTNPHGQGRRKQTILGGAYYDNEYNFNEYYSADPFERSIGYGIRLVQQRTDAKEDSLDHKVVSHIKRDILSEEDVSDAVFEVYKAQFDYAPDPVDVKLDTLASYDADYVVERFEMPTPYTSNANLSGYIVYYKRYSGDIKPILVFPSAGAIYATDSATLPAGIIKDKHYLLMEGYAVIHPVYYNTYDREKLLKTWWANESEEYKNSIIRMGKEYRRTIDYIETRADMDMRNLSYYGYSWGSIMSNTLLAIDDRINSAFLCVGGLQLPRSKKEINPAYFIRRIRTPIMHITGKGDGVFEYETSQIPMQKLLGTPKEDQEMIVLEDVGHSIPKDIRVEHHLRWLKRNEKQ